jgi:2TM domain
METQNTFSNAAGRDEFLWKLAQKRAAFQKHLVVYGMVNAFLWIVWAYTTFENPSQSRHIWPLSVMIWWGLGLAIQGITAYGIGIFDEKQIAEKEYQKLMNQ